jgi:AcrR family transcriptional regulator
MTQAPGGGDEAPDDTSKRQAILAAAAEVFFEYGYEAATTLEIATRARTSKRALYQHFAGKQEILTELIRSRSRQMQAPVDIPIPKSRAAFFETLRTFGASFLDQLLKPGTIEIYRLAIGGKDRSGKIGHELKLSGQGAVVQAVRRFLEHGAEQGYLQREDLDLALDVFFNVLIGPLQMALLLRTEKRPQKHVIRSRADRAVMLLERLSS